MSCSANPLRIWDLFKGDTTSSYPCADVPNCFPGEFLFLDESGDLGRSEQSTPVFVVALLHLRTANALDRVIKRARKRALGRHSPKNELKWSGSNDELRRIVIEEICKQSDAIVGVSAAVVDKRWIDGRLATRHEDLRYNYAVRFALEKGDLFKDDADGKRIVLTIDARNRRATTRLQEYIELFMENGELPCSVRVQAADSAQSPQLQVVDFVAGTIYAAYAHADWTELNRLKKAEIEVRLRVLKKRKPAP